MNRMCLSPYDGVSLLYLYVEPDPLKSTRYVW
jgi:hypothetical protein